MTNCDSICIAEWFFLFLWCISVPTYCMVMYTIWKHRKTKFKGEFWFLTMSLFVADILHLCQYMWALKLSIWGRLPRALLRAPHLFGWLMLVPQAALFFAEVMGVTFVSVNRYLAIMKPEYHTLWTRKTTMVCICIQWSVFVLTLLYHIPVQCNLVLNTGDNSTGGSFTVLVDPASSDMASLFLVLVFGICGLLRVFLFAGLYTRMFLYVYKQQRAVAPIQQDQQRSRGEINLAIMGGLLAVCDMAITINAVDVGAEIQRLGGNVGAEEIRVFAFRNACFTDVYGWMNAWLLLAFSGAVREAFLQQYGCKKSELTKLRLWHEILVHVYEFYVQ